MNYFIKLFLKTMATMLMAPFLLVFALPILALATLFLLFVPILIGFIYLCLFLAEMWK